MWRTLRITLLLVVLATVALGAWRAQTRATAWKNTLHVTIYPINADQRPATADYLSRLSAEDFSAIEQWLEAQARRYGIDLLRPIRITLAPVRQQRAPQPPRRSDAFDNILWSLQMRYWAWRNDESPGPRPDIRLFVQYHDPRATPAVQHSVGIEKGLIGLANVFASRLEHGSNLVVMAHEMLHTLGASDKYDPATLQPRYPDGYAESQRTPLYPQRLAEIMGGRIPRSPLQADIPRALYATVVGPLTAREIGWLR